MEAVTHFVDSFTENIATAQDNSTLLGQLATNRNNCVELTPGVPRGCSDPHSPYVTKAMRRVVEDVVHTAIIPLLTAVGVTGNVINMAVFTKQGLRDRVHLCLFSLSVTDLLVLTSMCLNRLDIILAHVIGRYRAAQLWLFPLIRLKMTVIPIGFQMVSMFISIVIAVDRCVCVTWPLHAARVLSTRVTGLVILGFGVLIFAGSQFGQFKFDVVCAFIAGRESSGLFVLTPSQLYKDNPVLMDILDSFVFVLLIPMLSFLITAAATTITAIKLKRATAWRDSSAAGSTGADVINQKERALTSMLVVISCIYMTCLVPRVTLAFCGYFIPEFHEWGKFCNVMALVGATASILMSINSTANFFVYYTMGSKFRKTVQQLLPCVASLLSTRTKGT